MWTLEFNPNKDTKKQWKNIERDIQCDRGKNYQSTYMLHLRKIQNLYN